MLTRQLVRQHYTKLPAGIGLLPPPEPAVVPEERHVRDGTDGGTLNGPVPPGGRLETDPGLR